MLKPGNILYVNTGDSVLASRIYQIESEFFMDNGRRWLVCHLFYENAPDMDKMSYPLKASSVERYVDFATDPEDGEVTCILMDDAELTKFLLERE